MNVAVNGEAGHLINLSCLGAQLMATLRLRPEEAIRVSLLDSKDEVRMKGVVAWSIAEPANGTVCYRAGIEFVEPDSMTLEAFCVRNIADPEHASPSAA